jgi:hypothetical protein
LSERAAIVAAACASGPVTRPLAALGGAADDGGAPFALAGPRSVDGPDLASAFLDDFDLAVFALGLSASSALSAFFADLPFPVLAGPVLAVPAFALPEPPAVARAPLRAVGALVLAVLVLAVAALDAVALAPLVRAGAALGARFAAVDLAEAAFWAVRDDAAFDAGLDAVLLAAVALAGAAASDLAASLSDVTAVSSALVADEMAVSALVSVFADVAACVAAAFSFVEADVTLVAAVETVRGVTVPVLRLVRLVPRAAVVRVAVRRAAVVVPLAPVVLAPVVLAPVVREPADLVEFEVFVAPDVFAALAGLLVRARELPRTGFAIRTGAALAVVFLVGGTDLLPPIWISYRGGHSTESNVLHI